MLYSKLHRSLAFFSSIKLCNESLQFLFGLSFLFLSFSTSAQSFLKPSKYGIQVGYAHTSFLSQSFKENINEGLLSHKIGWKGGLFARFGIVLGEIGYFGSFYETENLPIQLPEDVSIRNEGLELNLSVLIIPKSKNITPTLGLGFQYSALHTSESEVDEDFETSSVKTSGILWKAGLVITPLKNIGIHFDFKQSLPSNISVPTSDFLNSEIVFTDRQRALQQLTITLLINLNH